MPDGSRICSDLVVADPLPAAAEAFYFTVHAYSISHKLQSKSSKILIHRIKIPDSIVQLLRGIMDARQIIDRFGGQSALGELLGKGQSTVAHWAKTGIIPAKWQPKLLVLSMRHGVGLTASDLVDAPAPRSEDEVAWPSYSPATTALIASTAPFDATPTLAPSSIQFPGDGGGVEFRFDSGNQMIWGDIQQYCRFV
jgi:hypothetical protein